MNKILILICLCALLFMNSCDKSNYVHYIVENQSEDSIRINYSFYTYYSNEESESNSIVINNNREDTLFIFELISPSVYNKEDEDQLKYLTNVDIHRIIDTTKITKDVLLRCNWEYEKIADNFADFRLVIKEEDF